MDRRTLLLASAGLLIAPVPHGIGRTLAGLQALGTGAPPPAPPPVDTAFAAWREAFIGKAVAKGLPETRVRAELEGVAPDPHVITLDHRQPELTKPISAYLTTATSASNIAKGQAGLAANRAALNPIEDRTGVPGEVMVAIWGMESAFGAVQGSDDVIRSLATLAFDGRRQAWAEGELIAALKIIVSGEASRAQLRGSWAGAMGQTQFTPSDYLNFAVDGDGDGRRDIWGSSIDALASTANFLSRKAAWRREGAIQVEVVVPRQGFDYSLAEGPMKPVAAWTAMGVTAPHGLPDPAVHGDTAGLILPMGWQGPGFLIYPNHLAIRAYNNSTAYALGVGLLADRIAGGPPLAQAWPDDKPLTLADRIAAQQALAALGFDPGGADGVIGTGTRKAARAWQISRQLPADGYLSYDLIQRLKAEAGIGASPAPTPTAQPSAAPTSDAPAS
jgi:lytic murein transglycosylase